MRNRFCLYLTLLISLGSLQLPIFSSINSLKKDNEEVLGPEYLKNLPKNEYIIGPSDKLKIIVSREYEGLTTIEDVDGEGTIYLPKLNRVYVKGLTIGEMNKLLNEAYKEYIKYPSVEVQVLEFRPIKIYVEGEVESPGMKSLRGSYFINKSISENIDERFNQKFLDNVNQQISLNNFNNDQSYFFPTIFDAIRESGGITLYSDLSRVQIIRKNSLSNGGG